MKDFIKRLLENVDNPVLGRCLCKEYLQARVLQCLQDQGAFSTWTFQGGTALRFLYSIPRFSEDLDFALVTPDMEDQFAEYIETIRTTFDAEGYGVNVRVRDQRIVKSAFIRFEGLLFELGLSPHRSEVLAIKVEVDSNPPAGGRSVSTIVRRHVTLNLRHYDKTSLLAGKLHAILARPYTKGRDVYDLIWYLADRNWPEPNFELLNNALLQTGWDSPGITRENWQQILRQQAETWKWQQITADVMPFLERPEDAALLTKDNLVSLLHP